MSPEPSPELEEKPKSSLCLVMHCAMHTYGESFAFCIVHCGWCEPSASRSGHLTPRVTGTWIDGWVGLRAGLYFVVRRLVLGFVTTSEHHELLAFKAEGWFKDRKWSRCKCCRGARPNSSAAAAVMGIAECVWQLATGRTVRGSNPGGSEILSTRPDRPWGSPCLLYNVHRVIPGGKAAGTWR